MTDEAADHDIVDEESNELTMVAGTVIAARTIYVAQRFDRDRDDWNELEFSRLSFVDLRQSPTAWLAHDRDWQVNAMCVWDIYPHAKRLYVCLSNEGDVEMLGPGGQPTIVEHIDGAGLYRDWSRDLGYLDQVRQIGGSLYACGGANQVYRRTPDSDWELISAAILVDPLARQTLEQPMLGIRHLSDIYGASETDIYVAGEAGEVHHYDGEDWQKLETDTTRPLSRICEGPKGEIFICGAYGTLLRGDRETGFRSIWPLVDEASFTGIAWYGERIYLASTRRGLYVFDPVSGDAEPFRTGLSPEFLDPHRLEARDGVLWCFGFKDLAFFDGDRWTRVDHPDNPPITRKDAR